MHKFVLLMLCLAGPLMAAEEKITTKVSPIQKEVITIDDTVPEGFVGQRILIQDKDGKPAGEFDRTKWRIVPRDKKVVYRQTKTIECQKTADERRAAPSSGQPVFMSHTVGLLIGRGNTGLKTTAEDNQDLEVKQEKGLIFGASYQYHFDVEWGAQGVVVSNGDVLVGPTYSFNL